MIACSIALAIWCAALSWFHHRDNMRRNLDSVGQDESGIDAVEEDAQHKLP